jgi:hypothetical protein
MNKLFKTLLIVCLGTSSWAQVIPEYLYSATAWSSKSNISVALSQEEGLRKQKANAINAIPMGSLFAKNKVVLKFQGTKSNSRIAFDDTLKIFTRIEETINPQGFFKIYKATKKGENREFLGMTYSLAQGADRSNGDLNYVIRKISPGIFEVEVVGTKPGDELLFYIGRHEKQMASLTLGID